MYKIMTPGPTQVRNNVRMARSLETTNPDFDIEFVDYYKKTCDKLGQILGTKEEVYILSGEGVLGLEAVCASITEPDDRVLVIDNGIYGRYFADFVKIYDGDIVYFKSDYQKAVEYNDLAEFLKKDSNFKYATLVHCDTPSGVLNPVETLCPLLNSYGILTVVDSVSASFGEEINIDKSCIDILCGASQKALSAPPGLTFVSVSSRALKIMEERETTIKSFYCNLLIFKNYYEKKWFPYTMPTSDIIGLNCAIDNVLNDKDILNRHENIAKATRFAIKKSGLSLYLSSGYSNTVTVINVPDGITDKLILDTMKNEYKIMLAGCFDELKGKVFRIGHMGENANIKDMTETLDALDKAFYKFGVKLNCSIKEEFLKYLKR